MLLTRELPNFTDEGYENDYLIKMLLWKLGKGQKLWLQYLRTGKVYTTSAQEHHSTHCRNRDAFLGPKTFFAKLFTRRTDKLRFWLLTKATVAHPHEEQDVIWTLILTTAHSAEISLRNCQKRKVTPDTRAHQPWVCHGSPDTENAANQPLCFNANLLKLSATCIVKTGE